MASVGERKRRAKASRIHQVQLPGVEPKAEPRAAATVTPIRQKTGLEWLLSKQRISTRQFKAGERYGAIFRGVQLGAEFSIKSNLDQSVGGGVEIKLGRSSTELETAEWIGECKRKIIAARAAVGYHDMVQGMLDVVAAAWRRSTAAGRSRRTSARRRSWRPRWRSAWTFSSPTSRSATRRRVSLHNPCAI